jgi:hypothetical protein
VDDATEAAESGELVITDLAKSGSLAEQEDKF